MELLESYKVFLSFKNTESDGRYTRDRAIAEELYEKFSICNIPVFFSEVTVQEHGISDYMELINEALDVCNVLIVIGTKAEHLTSKWVKYEWDSFIQDIFSGIKGNGQVITLVDDVPIVKLQRQLRTREVFEYKDNGIINTVIFTINYLVGIGAMSEEERKEALRNLGIVSIPNPVIVKMSGTIIKAMAGILGTMECTDLPLYTCDYSIISEDHVTLLSVTGPNGNSVFGLKDNGDARSWINVIDLEKKVRAFIDYDVSVSEDVLSISRNGQSATAHILKYTNNRSKLSLEYDLVYSIDSTELRKVMARYKFNEEIPDKISLLGGGRQLILSINDDKFEIGRKVSGGEGHIESFYNIKWVRMMSELLQYQSSPFTITFDKDKPFIIKGSVDGYSIRITVSPMVFE